MPAPTGASPNWIAPGSSFTRAQFEAFVQLHYGYDGVYFNDAYLNALPTSFASYTPGLLTADEPGTGPRPDIGFNIELNVAWMCTFDSRARASMLAQADCSKWHPVHQYVISDGPGVPPRPWLYTQSTGDPTLQPDPIPNPSEISIDYAHHPQFLFFPCLLMAIEGNTAKFNEYLTEFKFWTVGAHYSVPPNGRQYEKGIFHVALQGRAQAWGLRNLVMLHFVLKNYASDQTDWIAWTKQAIEWNIRYVDGMFRTGDFITDGSSGGMNFAPYYDYAVGAYKNTAGITVKDSKAAYGAGNDGTTAVIAPWQLAWQQAVFMWSSRLGLGLASDVTTLHGLLAQFCAKFIVMLYGPANDPTRFDYRVSGQYVFYVGNFRTSQGVLPTDGQPRAIDYYTTDAQFMAQLSYLGTLPADDHKFRNNGTAAPMDDTGLGNSYVDMMLVALTQAVEISAAGSTASYALAEGTTQFQHGDAGATQDAILPTGKWFQIAGAPANGTTPSSPPYVPPPAPTPAPTPSPPPAPASVDTPTSTNVALAANGGVATATSSFSSLYGPAFANDGIRTGTTALAHTFWNSGTANHFPDTLTITFNGKYNLTQINLFSLQDAQAALAPTLGMICSQYGLKSFVIQYYNDTTAAWVDVPGGTATSNMQVWFQANFAPTRTSAIRVTVNASQSIPPDFSRVCEFEAFTFASAGSPSPSPAPTPSPSPAPSPPPVSGSVVVVSPQGGNLWLLIEDGPAQWFSSDGSLPPITIRRMKINIDSPETMRGVINAGSTARFEVTLYDDAFEPIAPESIAWMLVDEARRPIFGGSVDPVSESNMISIPGKYIAPSVWYAGGDGLRSLEVSAVYNGGEDTITGNCDFRVRKFS